MMMAMMVFTSIMPIRVNILRWIPVRMLVSALFVMPIKLWVVWWTGVVAISLLPIIVNLIWPLPIIPWIIWTGFRMISPLPIFVIFLWPPLLIVIRIVWWTGFRTILYSLLVLIYVLFLWPPLSIILWIFWQTGFRIILLLLPIFVILLWPPPPPIILWIIIWWTRFRMISFLLPMFVILPWPSLCFILLRILSLTAGWWWWPLVLTFFWGLPLLRFAWWEVGQQLRNDIPPAKEP